jgi:hypothetical protein
MTFSPFELPDEMRRMREIEDQLRQITQKPLEIRQMLEDGQRHRTIITDVARQIEESHRLYDAAIHSLTTSTTMNTKLKAINEAVSLEKESIVSITSYLDALPKQDTLSSSIDSMMRSAIENQKHWQETIKNLDIGSPLAELTLRHDTTAMLSASLAVQSKLLELQPYRLGAAIDAAASLQQSFSRNLDTLATSYNRLFNFISHQPSAIVGIESIITRYPPLELFHEAELLKQISIPENEQEVLDVYELPIVPEERSLEDWLREIDPGLPRLLQGARDALSTANPDRTRHITTSMRELFTHVLHHLAPDDDIQAWTTDTRCYDKGRPTRRARLLYINRGINIGDLSNFVDADVKSILFLMTALQSGTHRIDSRWNDQQLRALVDRVELSLLFLFRLNSTNE